jgi:UrcA family protein
LRPLCRQKEDPDDPVTVLIQESPMNVTLLKRASVRLGSVALSVIATSTLFLAATGVARAATADDQVPSKAVRYDDLNLSTESGTHTLYERIASAAKQVCPATDGHNLSAIAAAHDCERAAIDRAVQQVNNPRLAAENSVHHAKRG